MVKSSLKSSSKSPSKSVTIGRDCTNNNIYSFILMAIGIAINIVIIVSLNNLEHSNCKCAELSERRFIKEWFMFLIFFNLTIFLLFTISNEACWANFINYPFIFGSMLIFGLINIIMIIRLFIYVRILRNSCSCGYGNKEIFIFWYLIILFSMWALFAVLLFLTLLFTAIKFSNM